MPPPTVPLKELSTAVQNAVEKVLAQHGALGIDHLWVGFVAPDAIATQANAQKIATELGHGAGIAVQASVAQIAAGSVQAGVAKAEAIPKPGHIIGLIYKPR